MIKKEYQKFEVTGKVIFRENSISLKDYIRKKRTSVADLKFYLKNKQIK